MGLNDEIILKRVWSSPISLKISEIMLAYINMEEHIVFWSIKIEKIDINTTKSLKINKKSFKINKNRKWWEWEWRLAGSMVTKEIEYEEKEKE